MHAVLRGKQKEPDEAGDALTPLVWTVLSVCCSKHVEDGAPFTFALQALQAAASDKYDMLQIYNCLVLS